MNKKLIKELELLRFYKEKEYLDLHYKLLIDYIDDLETENKELKEQCEKQRYAITENCDLRLEIERLKEQLIEVLANETKLEIKNEKLQEENNYLKLNNPEQNIEHFRIIKENKRKIDNLRKENTELHNKIDKAIELAKRQLLSNSNYTSYTDEMCLKDLLEILKDSDVDE